MKHSGHLWRSLCLILLHLIIIEAARQFSIKLLPQDYKLNSDEIVDKYLKYAQQRPNEEVSDCARECKKGNDKRICYYEFVVETYQAMGVACGNCTLGNFESCNQDQCVMADGVERTVYTVNRQIPGTKIDVCKGDLIAVNVRNRIGGSAITMHWHGMLMRGTQYMDGVPMVTQCPIPAGNDFLYAFWGTDAGTFFYHTHTGEVRCNGVTGPLLIRENPKDDPNSHLYDVDAHHIFLQDWTTGLTDNFAVGLPTRPPGIVPQSILVNGQGKTTDPDTQNQTATPYKIFHVSSNKRYRFRLVASTCFVCPLRVQIENHNFTVISSDAFDLKPRVVDSVLIYPGERYDFVLNCNQNSGSYWIHVKAVGICIAQRVYQLAVLAYDQDPGDLGIVPSSPTPSYDGYDEGTILNHPNSTCERDDPRLCIHTLQAYEADKAVRDRTPDVVKIAAFANVALTLDEVLSVDSDNWIPFMNVAASISTAGTISRIQNLTPRAPLLSQFNDVDPSSICYSGHLPARCNATQICSCVHLEPIRLNSYVTLIITDGPRAASSVNHPAHLHAYGFQVIEVGQFGGSKNVTLDGLLTKKFNNRLPPLKDTVSVPSNGYAVVKFKADNPGIWMMHCHIEAHMISGMMMAFQVGEFSDYPPVPKTFPKCGNYF